MISPRTSILFFTISLALPLGLLGQEASRTLPAAPATLLAALPLPPAEWRLVKSEASHVLGGWLETKATRIYEAAAGVPNTNPEGQIQISVTDTGGDTIGYSQFLEFQPGIDGTLEKLLIGNLQALVLSEPGSPVITQVLAESRFVAEITIIKLPNQKAEPWLKQINFDALRQIPFKAVSKLPRQLQITTVDQLNKERNRTYTTVVSTPIGNETSEPTVGQ